MAKNYAALARSVIAALGGVDNISAVTHCMTRLRFVIKDDQLIDSPTLKTISGVLGVVRSDNQCGDYRQYRFTSLSGSRQPAAGRYAARTARG